MSSDSVHHRGRSRNQARTQNLHSRNRISSSLSAVRSQNRHRSNHHRGHSSDQRGIKERSQHHQINHHNSEHDTSRRNRERSTSLKKQEVSKYDPCVCGPDLFTNVLGPTPDETLLVGLQTFLGFCCGQIGRGSNRHHEQEKGPPSEDEPSTASDSVEQSSDIHNLAEETEIENISESHFLSGGAQNTQSLALSFCEEKPCLALDKISVITENNYEKNSDNISEKNSDNRSDKNSDSRFDKTSDNKTEKSSDNKSDKSTDHSEKQTSTTSTEVKETVSTESRESQTEYQHSRSEKSLETGEMSEHSSQTDHPSQETRTSQTSMEKRRKQKKACICKVIAEQNTSEPSMKNNHCNCSTCCGKRRSKQNRRCKNTAPCTKTKSGCVCSTASVPVNANRKICSCSSTDMSYSTEDDDNNILMKNGQVGLIKYAITKITKFCSYTTFEIMKSTRKKPKVMPTAVEGVFVLKNTKDS